MTSALDHALRNAPPRQRNFWLNRVGPRTNRNATEPEVVEQSPRQMPDSTSRNADTESAVQVALVEASSKTKPSDQQKLRPQTTEPESHLAYNATAVAPQYPNMDSIPTPMHLSPRFGLSRANSTESVNSASASLPVPTEVNGSDTLQVPVEPVRARSCERLQKWRDGIHDMSALLKAIRAPLPDQTGDGTYLPKEEQHGLVDDCEDIIHDLNKLGVKNLDNLIEMVGKAKLKEPLDDRKYYMERLIQAASRLPNDLVGTKLTDTFVTTLWNDLDHPPNTLLGQDYQYRQPDGSNNNCYFPHIGRAGAPYARTVTPQLKQSGSLPDPGVLFDTLLARQKPVEHPTRISSFLFYFASIIIHDVFKTDHKDYRISKTSSYLDLAPLYGSDWEEQKRMRTFKDGSIKPDCFSETRLLSFPPGVGALLIMFNRYHNYIASQLALINEDGRFSDGEKTVERYGETLNMRDDDLFQTARLITCGLYVNIILIDYVRTILNLNRTDSNWQLNPRVDIPGGPDRGKGNQVSAEFNLVYRWHATISERDDKWTQELFEQYWPDKNFQTVSELELIKDLGHMDHYLQQQDPMDRSFPPLKKETLQRQEEGPFAGMYKDDDLAAIITAGIEDCANAFGPQQVPLVMKAVEVLGIQQARSWHMATLNEFRKHFDLEPHMTFDDITTNKEVAEALKHLYDHPDNVELYPGLVVEDAKIDMVPGSGLCPGYTISRGVLSDATTLVRGDRFFTTSYTPESLTNFGYTEASSDTSIDNGCVLYKLLLRGLPNNYSPQSVYVHYPMTIPKEMKKVLKDLDKDHKYDFSKPHAVAQPAVIFGYEAAKRILDDQQTFHVTWGKAMKFLMGPKAANFALAGDHAINAASRDRMEKALYFSSSPDSHPACAIPTGHEDWLKEVRSFYATKTEELLRQKSYRLGKLNQVDIIRDVGNLVHVHFAAAMFSLPLKSIENPHGIFTEHEMYLIFAAVFTAIFFDIDPPKSFPLRQQAYTATQKLGEIVQFQVASVMKTGNFAGTLMEAVIPQSKILRDYGVHMIKRLCESEPDIADLVWGNIMGTMGGMVANQGQLWSQAMDWFLASEENMRHLHVVSLLAKEHTAEADDQIMHYFLEAVRLNGESGVNRVVASDVEGTITIEDSNGEYSKTHTLKAGDKVMVDFKAASRDPSAFPDPDELRLDRPIESYITFGWGPHQCLGLPMTRVALSTVLKVVGGLLENLRPATVSVGKKSGPAEVKKVVKEFFPGSLEVLPESWHYHGYLTEDWDMEIPFPTSLKVNWDGPPLDAPANSSSGNDGP